MKDENRNAIAHILKNIAQRGNGNSGLKVRQDDLDKIWNIIEEDKNERVDTTVNSKS